MSFDSAAPSGDSVSSLQPLTTFSSCDSRDAYSGNRSDTASGTAANKLPVVELDGPDEQSLYVNRTINAEKSTGQVVLPDFGNFTPPKPSAYRAETLQPGGPSSPGIQPFRPFPDRPDAHVLPGDRLVGPIAPAPMVGSFTADQVRLILADRDRAVALNRGQLPRELPKPGVGPVAPSPDGRIPLFPKPDRPLSPSDTRPSKIEFSDDFGAARQAAIDSGRPLIVSFSKSGCGACTQLDSESWPNQTGLVNDNAIRVKINGSRNRDLAQQYGVNAYPTTVVVNPKNMEMLETARGAISSRDLTSMLNNAFSKYRAS